MREIDSLIIHCTATRPEWMARASARKKVAEIDRWHRAPPFNFRCFAYHELIDRDGVIATGRKLELQGAHTRGHNASSIGVVLVGGHSASADDEFADHFTDKQDTALRNLIAALRHEFLGLSIYGHNEFANKGCPGFNVRGWLAAAGSQ